MKDSRRRQGMPTGGAAAVFAWVISIVALAVMPLLALAAVPTSSGATQENPRFASLLIEIWPEFDRPAALVIIKGELAAGLILPATVTLRIPASSGGPSAVAFATAAARTELFNLAYERTDADNLITLRFKVPQRFFHVEFYDPLVTSTPDRRYTYVWPDGPVVDQLSVRVQEPAAASNVSVRPDLGTGFTGSYGLLYRTADLGALKAGRQLPIEIRYTRADSRTSSEILKLNALESTSEVATGFIQGVPGWLQILVFTAALAVSAGATSLWWRRRKKASGTQPGGAAYCPQCSNRLVSGDRFCSTCGAPVRER